jgi:ribonuclease J
LYIHTASEPYDEEQVLSEERVVDKWLDKFGMERHQMHCSGHAKGKDLFEIVKTINAISNSYTEHPEKYVRVITSRNTTVVDEGNTYLI